VVPVRTALIVGLILGGTAVGVVVVLAQALPCEGQSLMGYVRCALRGRHNPVRHPLGGFKCADCSLAGVDMEALGFPDSSHITPRGPE